MIEFLRNLRFEGLQSLQAKKMRREVTDWVEGAARPRIALVKQDIQDDLYFCCRETPPKDVVKTTLMRSGPVALFTRLHAEFLIVKTEPDPECQAWQEKATELGWYTIESLTRMRNSVPGRDCGQSHFAVSCSDVDWSAFDIVISIDISIPARITRQFPKTLWCYYIREPKTSSYSRSLSAPLPGQNVFLNQRFGMHPSAGQKPHVVDFPYYLQYFGCLHEVLEIPQDTSVRNVLFLEHHTPEGMSAAQLNQLAEIGTLDSTCHISSAEGPFGHYNEKCLRPPPEIYRALIYSKYFISCPKARKLWGNAAVEAVAAGALVIGDPTSHANTAVFSRRTTTSSFTELLQAIRYLENHPAVYRREVLRQRAILDYLCYSRPLHDLFCRHITNLT